MKNFLRQFKNAIMGSDEEPERMGNFENPMTNQDLEDKVMEIYKTRFKEESTKYSMAYPTCFRIYLHSRDFKARQEAFSIIARDLQTEFCNFNRSEMHKYKHNRPNSQDWLFQFIEFKDGTMVENINTIEMGEIYVISTLYSKDFSKKRENISNEGSIRMTKSPKNSTNPQQLNNIKLDAFLGMDMLDGNRFKIPIRENYEDTASIPKSEDRAQVYDNNIIATLICDKNFISGSSTGNKYSITDNYVEISGINDTRTGLQYIKVDSDSLPNSIVHIRHENGNFFLAAFGKVSLNGMTVKESKGGDLHWEPLSVISRMIINDEISIEFKKMTWHF